MKKTRFLIVDDHGVVRDGVRLVLASNPDYTVVGEATDGEEAVKMAREHTPDVIIMDISMPKLNGIEATTIIKKENPDVKIIVLTVHEDEEYIFEILRAGASGYVLKNAGKKEIFAAVKSALSGERFFSPGISDIIITGFVRRVQGQAQPPADTTSRPVHSLTNREVEILQYIAKGHTNRQIAGILFLSIRTVNTHRTNLMQKLDIHDTATLVRYAIESGIVKLDK